MNTYLRSGQVLTSEIITDRRVARIAYEQRNELARSGFVCLPRIDGREAIINTAHVEWVDVFEDAS